MGWMKGSLISIDSLVTFFWGEGWGSMPTHCLLYICMYVCVYGLFASVIFLCFIVSVNPV